MEDKKIKINGMAIASALGAISSVYEKVFANPPLEKPDPNEILPTNLIRWPKGDF